jgi:hypothetical protein
MTFSAMAQDGREEDVAVKDLKAFSVHEIGLIIAPREDQQMLQNMGILALFSEERGARRRTLFGRPIEPRLTRLNPYFTEFGIEVIAACEDLFTPEEHEAANEAAKPELERLRAEMQDLLDSRS